jgi:hypothetical protein
MSSRQLILHIGCHKTGSSSIQKALYDSRPALEGAGFVYFCRHRNDKLPPIRNANSWLQFRDGDAVECDIRRDLAPALVDLPGNVIVSAEHFSWVVDPAEIAAFHEQLTPHFDDIKVVAYVRRQDKQAISHYQQGSEFRAFAASRYYAGNYRALPPYRDELRPYLDYCQRLGEWGNVFGDAKMLIRVFDRTSLHQGDVVADLAHITGLPVAQPAARMNESNSFEQTKLGHLMNAQGYSRRLRNLLLGYADDAGKLLPARSDAQHFYEHFKESNRRLNGRFSINELDSLFEEDFSMYPEESADTWDEALANRALLNLLEGVNHLPVLEIREARWLHRAAESLAGIDAQQAVALHMLAARLGGGEAPAPPDPGAHSPKWKRALKKWLGR